MEAEQVRLTLSLIHKGRKDSEREGLSTAMVSVCLGIPSHGSREAWLSLRCLEEALHCLLLILRLSERLAVLRDSVPEPLNDGEKPSRLEDSLAVTETEPSERF